MQKELISAYVDGEHQDNLILDALCKDEILQQTWNRYHLVRATIRQESSVLLGTEFTDRIASLIEEESLQRITVDQPIPGETHTSPFMQKFKQWLAPISQVAVAASVCLIAVLGVQTYSASQAENNVPVSSALQTLPFANNLQQVSYNAPVQEIPSSDQLEQQTHRINVMLQNYELQRRVNTPTLNQVSSDSVHK